MASVPTALITAQLPRLRRYARALTGSQRIGDRMVQVCLEAVVTDRPSGAAATASRLDLFRLFHDVRPAFRLEAGAGRLDVVADPIDRRMQERLIDLPDLDRQLLLLTELEGFSPSEAAAIVRIDDQAAVGLLKQAWATLRHQAPTRVLIIEDEPVIALDIASIVRAMGHSVAGVASRLDMAIDLAHSREPGLVLADIQLQDGSTGVDAVDTILKTVTLPVVFVTAFPERLLTGERREPEFVVEKPFESKTLEVAVSQALFCAPSGRVARSA